MLTLQKDYDDLNSYPGDNFPMFQFSRENGLRTGKYPFLPGLSRGLCSHSGYDPYVSGSINK